eukprot:194110-Chlamydomonas_euryale.AAC.7
MGWCGPAGGARGHGEWVEAWVAWGGVGPRVVHVVMVGLSVSVSMLTCRCTCCQGEGNGGKETWGKGRGKAGNG